MVYYKAISMILMVIMVNRLNQLYDLVGDFNHLEKYEFVNGKGDISYMKWKIKAMFESTKQIFLTYNCRLIQTHLSIGLIHLPSTQPLAKYQLKNGCLPRSCPVGFSTRNS